MAAKKSSNKLPPFVPLLWEVLNSKAYISLTYASAKALPYFLGKYKGPHRDADRYQTSFHFSYSEAKRYGYSPATFSKVIQELIRKGFLDPVDKGGLRSDGKSYSFFRLSRRWEKYGCSDFASIEWKCFVPKPRLKATSKSERGRYKKGNKQAPYGKDISQSDAVRGISG